MPTVVLCSNPACTARLSVADEAIGRQIKCKKCGTSFTATSTIDGTAPSPSPKGSVLPKSIGRYQVRSKLGSGAFGTVYRAYDTQLDREVALKLLKPETLSSPQAVERFQREARAAARLTHPHIVPVFDAGKQGNSHFIASAFIPGRTLADAIPKSGMPARQAVALVIQLADALDYAHEQRVLHRDVKPCNIMLDARDHLYLMDFGLAGWLGDERTRLTCEGALMGTPAFMAPEQASGDLKQIGPAVDQYSAGVVLYQLLTGRLPFEGPVAVVIYHVLNTVPPPPSQHRTDLDPRLAAICLKAMAKRPGDRYPGAAAFAAALREWLGVAPAPSAGPRPAPDPLAATLPTHAQLARDEKTVEPLPLHDSATKNPPPLPGHRTQQQRRGNPTNQLPDRERQAARPNRHRTRRQDQPRGLGFGFWALILLLLAGGGTAFWFIAMPLLTRNQGTKDAAEVSGVTPLQIAPPKKDVSGGPPPLIPRPIDVPPPIRIDVKTEEEAETLRKAKEKKDAEALRIAKEKDAAEALRKAMEEEEALRKALAEDMKSVTKLALTGKPNAEYFKKNAKARLVVWQKAAEAGIAEGQLFLGRCYQEGAGVAKDEKKAFEWLSKSAEQGLASAQTELGVAYEDGLGVEKNPIEALSWYRKAANQGDAVAQTDVGACYMNAIGVEKDAAEAVRWYLRAAAQEHALAQCNLGDCYRDGLGVEKDEKEAVRWYRKAADQGDEVAQFELGLSYQTGRGVAIDAVEAAKWYRKAADQGNAEAQYDLAVMYEAGSGGLPKSEAEAIKWYRKAAAQGDEDAQLALKRLNK